MGGELDGPRGADRVDADAHGTDYLQASGIEVDGWSWGWRVGGLVPLLRTGAWALSAVSDIKGNTTREGRRRKGTEG